MIAYSIAAEGFYRGDLVEVGRHRFEADTPRQQRLFRVHSTQRPGSSVVKLCRDPFRRGLPQMTVRLSDVELKQRGNWFNYRAGRPLSFDSFDDEVMFWQLQHKMHELSNPADGQYASWTISQAIDALRSKSADAFTWSSDLSGEPDDRILVGYKHSDPEIAEWMRSRCLKDLVTAQVS